MVTPKPILLVEDDADVHDMLCDEIKEAGHTADCVKTLGEALRKVRPHSHALAICDAVLPDGTGRELAKLAEAYGIRTLLITGHPDIAAELAHADIPHLRKPFSLALLREVLQQLLTSR
jgi:DNA-binding response OmpR family regulator